MPPRISASVTKTVLIWDQIGEAPLHFIVLDGDYRHLDGIYINSSGSEEDERKQDELSDLIYDSDGNHRQKWLDKFPVDVVGDGVVVIVAGFLP